jgi:hypothetical protein
VERNACYTGMHGRMVDISLICEFFSIDQGSVEIGSDCKAALLYFFTKEKFISSKTDTFVLIMVAQRILNRLPISYYHRHISAHQKISRDEMYIWGRANDNCDREAEELWQLEDDKGTTVESSLCIGEDKISTQIRATLYNYIHNLHIVWKWQDHGWDGVDTFNQLDIKVRREAEK